MGFRGHECGHSVFGARYKGAKDGSRRRIGTLIGAGVLMSGSLVAIGGQTVLASAAPAPIKVMVMGTISSTSISSPQQVSSVQAAADAANAKGGINGHKIVVITCNDNLDPDQDAACARTAVSDHVAAAVEVEAPFIDEALPILQRAHIPLLGDTPDTPQELTSPISFPISGGSYTMFSAMGTALVKDAHCTKVAIVTLNLPSTESSAQNIAASIQLAGGTVTGTQDVSFTLASFAPVVATAQSSGADCIANILGASGIVGLFSALEGSADPNMLVASPGTSFTPMLISELSGLTGSSLVTQFTYEASSNIRPFAAQMKKYEPSVALDNYDIDSWQGMTEFIDVAKTLPAGKVTAYATLSALNKSTDLHIAGLPVPVDFAKANPVAAMKRVTENVALVYDVTKQGTYVRLPSINAQAGLATFLSSSSG